MGTSLNGLTPAGTYPGLIKTGDNAPIDGTLKTLSDGNGNNLPMAVSTTAVNFTNQLQQSGVAVPTASQVAAKQDTLVSGTNIKTINGTSVLGSGDIVTPYTPPSGVSGAIQFSNGSAFASDAANLFWDDTNNRLGIGTNAPASALNFGVNSYITYNNLSSNSYIGEFGVNNCLGLQITGNNPIRFLTDSVERMRIFGNGNTAFGSTTDLGARVGIKGSGSTSATTSLLVQNSAGTAALTVKDDLSATFGSTAFMNNVYLNQIQYNSASNTGLFPSSGGWLFSYDNATSNIQIARLGYQGTKEITASLQVDSTTQGFLPPRMTTTQKNAIATPAAGLVVYDSTTNKLCCYNGSTWNDLF